MRVLQDEPLAFLVNLGDFAGNPTPAEHHFVIAEMATEMLTPYPIFLVPGNHDVGGTGFTTADFERCYGPHQFAFRYGPDLFVILRYIRGQPTGPAETFLNTVLERERASARHVFVFMHTPLGVSPAFAKAGAPDAIAGDLHGYRRLERDGVRFLVSGGGGASLDKRSPYGRFHHALVLDVGPDGIGESVLRVPHALAIQDRLELWAIVRAGPWLERTWYVAAVVAGAWLLVIVLAWRSFIRGGRRPMASCPSP